MKEKTEKTIERKIKNPYVEKMKGMTVREKTAYNAKLWHEFFKQESQQEKRKK